MLDFKKNWLYLHRDCISGSREQAAAPIIHFQVQAATVQSQFNTNCFGPDKCACARLLTPPVSACGATLVAADTKIHRYSPRPETRKNAVNAY